MKIFEYLKKPMGHQSGNNNNTQKKFILEDELANTDEMFNETHTIKKKFSFKSSRSYINEMMQKKLSSHETAKPQPTSSIKTFNEDTSTRMCFDNYAYGAYMNNEMCQCDSQQENNESDKQ